MTFKNIMEKQKTKAVPVKREKEGGL